ncbi:sensor histidine kinase [Microbacterium rhizomatis]|nr:histidine kinase [Microbacterium rhizomatis]
MNPDTLPPDVAWPKQSWFLRGPMLSTAVMIAAITALVTELCVMLFAGEESLGYVGIGLSAAGLLVIFRARWVGLALTTVGGVASALYATEYIGVWTVTVFAMFLFAKQGRYVIPAMAISASSLYLTLVHRDDGQFDAPVALVAATFCVAAAAAGSVVRLQTESWDAARKRAIDLAAAQSVELRQAVTDERLRIARDLHDVVGHELAVVNINVGVAEVSLPSDAGSAREALRAAREGLQRTLQETQQILDLLRDVDSWTADRSELALLEHIPSLVARLTGAGAQIVAQLDPDPPELDADVSAAAYRIVQEALTNAGKYATGPARLTIGKADKQLIIDIRNPQTLRPLSGEERTGYGLVGMRERTQAAGGTIEITRSEDTFGVHVELPTKANTP